MAGQVLLTISKDEQERARLTSEYKHIVDQQSKVVDARRAGAAERDIIIARNMKSNNESIEKIVMYTGLSREDVEGLQA